MATSINWATKVISVPQADLTSLGGGIYELDVNAFRLELKALEASEDGMPFDTTNSHNGEVTLAGTTYARSIEIINGYTVTFEDGTYTVKCSGANHNIGDVKNVNSVSLIIGNSAGLITVVSGSGVTPADVSSIASAVWEETAADHTTTGTTGKTLIKASKPKIVL